MQAVKNIMIKSKHILIIVLSLFITLLCIDIFAGIWYWNRNNLIFNSTKFNNIVTPFLTIVSVIIYAWALFTTTKQNKIILSQNIKPFYEREIEKLYKKAKKTKIKGKILEQKEINLINYTKHIRYTFITLKNNKEFQEDYDMSFSDSNFDDNHFDERSYILELLFLTQFTSKLNQVNFFYSDLKSFIEEINNSKLIPEDKFLLKKQIERTFLLEYMRLVRILKSGSLLPPIPMFLDYPRKEKIDFKSLGETDFAEHYDYFEQQFK